MVVMGKCGQERRKKAAEGKEKVKTEQ